MRAALALSLPAAPQARKRARIEIIPLIDIMFFLLASFMLVSLSMGRLQGLQMRLPSAVTAAATPEPAPVAIVQLLADGALRLVDGPERRACSPAEMLQELKQRQAEAKSRQLDLRVLVRADRHASHGAVIALLDELRAHGFDRVTFGLRPTVLPRD